MMNTGHLLLAFLLVTISIPTRIHAGPGTRISARDLIAIRVPSELALAPDGRSAAFVVSEADFERSRTNKDLYLAPVPGDPRRVRRLTHTPDADETEPRFSPDGRWLAFVADRAVPKAGEKPAEGEEPKKQVWIMPVDGGEARPLTSAEEGVFHFDWAPDSGTIVFTAREVLPAAESERKEADKKRKVDPTVVDLERFRVEFWTATVESGAAKRISSGDLGVDGFRIAPDGRALVFESNLTGRPDDTLKTNLWVMSLPDGKTRQLTTTGGGTSQARWSPDGSKIAYTAYSDPRYEYSRVDLFVVDAAGGEPLSLSKALDRSVARFAWKADGKRLVAVVVDGVNQPVYEFGVAASSPEHVTHPGTFVSDVAVSRAGNAVAVAEGRRETPDLWTLDARPSSLTDLNPAFQGREVARQDVIRWKAPDGLEIEGVLTYPLDYKEGTRVPLVLAMHGGPFGVSESTLRGGYYLEQMWAAEGYAVLQPNFRGSDGYGDAFSQANRGDIGGKDYEDIMAGVEKVIQMGVADPNRMGVMGLSYGGYMTNLIVSRTERFKGAISESGIFNLVTDFSNSVYPSWEVGYLGGYYWDRDKLQLYVERSAFRNAERIKTPVLILHGEEDANTFISNSKEMYQALRALGRTVEFAHYPREEHGFEEPNHLLDKAERWVRWFSRYVKGEPPDKKARYVSGEYASAGGWEYTVASVDGKGEYTGRKAAGRFVEVTILLRSAVTGSRTLGVSPRDVTLELPDGRRVEPVGAAMAASGARAILTGDTRLEVSAPQDGSRGYVPLVVVFDVPADTKSAIVRLGPNAPFAVEISGE
jgi:dipeptidyl aminopeptidase/acylaminoacyl peptidase